MLTLTVHDFETLSDIERDGGRVLITHHHIRGIEYTTINGHPLSAHRVRRLAQAGKLRYSGEGLFAGHFQTLEVEPCKMLA